ncbi:MAG: hypothetical protein ACI85E_001668 [Marinomonas primoryensis]|jgi:hypothetical protein
MKWKVALTAEESALFITGLSEYSSLAEAKEAIGVDEVLNPYSEYWHDWNDGKSAFNEAVDLKNTLWDEIQHAWGQQELEEGCGSILVLDSWLYNDECCESLSKKGCKVTKESLAAWVYEMAGLDRAKMIYPNFDPNNRPATKFDSNTTTKEASSVSYPAKLQLAIDAHNHFWLEKNAGDQPNNSEVEAWLHEKAKDLNIRHDDQGRSTESMSNKVKEVIAQIIKPDLR